MKLRKFNDNGKFVVTSSCHPELVSGSHEMLKQVQHDSTIYCILNAWKTQQLPNGF